MFVAKVARLRIGFVAIVLAVHFPSFSQKEASNWLLGPVVGVTFKLDGPEKLTPGAIKANSIHSVMSDAKGNLLFYTDGNKVWDRTHKEMPHGNNIIGSPGASCIQIVPKPGDPSRYYIFTTKGNNWGAPIDAARYSEVDLCLNNSLGDVIESTKNTPLMSVAALRAAVVKHRNGVDYWIAFHKWQSSQLYCYKVSSGGVSSTPVVSTIGAYLGFSSNSTGDAGEMKFSPNGKKLAMAIQQYAGAEVFEFNDETGTFSNPVQIPAMYRQNYITPDYTYGIEFSPDGQKLYLSRTNGCLLTQYDLSSGNESTIVKSRVILAGDTLHHQNYDYYVIHGLQLGPDGSLYAAWIAEKTSGVSVISNPNAQGVAAQYQHNIIRWDNSAIAPDYFYSFPTFSADFFEGRPAIQNDFTCVSPSIKFWLDFNYAGNMEEVSKVYWNFDDPVSGIANKSEEMSPTHEFLTAGIHSLTCTITWSDGVTELLTQTLTIPTDGLNGVPAGLGQDTTLCPGATLRLEATGFGGPVLWQDGTINDHFPVTSPGIYWFNTCHSDCIVADSIKVSFEEIDNFLGDDQTVCEGDGEMILNAGPHHVIRWQDNTTSRNYTVTKPGTYWVTTQKNYCITTDSIKVDFCEKAVFIPNVVTSNGDGHNDHFILKGINNEACSLTIIDRNGSLVYQTNSYRNDWTGAEISTGVYYYIINDESTQRSFKGWIQVMH